MPRNDGRANDKLRKIKITRNYMKHAEGSCLIEVGNTKVICTSTIEETVPPFLRGTGNGWITAEYGMLPRSCISRINREKTSGRTYEIQRLIGRSLRSVIDTRRIGERTVKIDCDVIQADGGTRTASISGAFIALVDSLEKMKNESVINEIPILNYIAATSVGMLEGSALLDLTYEEDSKAEVDMNVVMTADDRLIEIQGTAERRPFSKMEMDKMLHLAKKGIEEIVDMQRTLLKGVI